MIKTSLIGLGITVILAIIPFSLLRNSSNIYMQMHLRPLCLAHQEPQWNICVSCFQSSEEKFLKSRGLVVQDTNLFKLWELPSSEQISCQELLQFVDFQNTEKKDISQIAFQDSSTFQQLSKKLNIVKQNKAIDKIQLSPKVQHFAVFEIGPQWNAGLSVRQISRFSMQFLKKFITFQSELGIVFLWFKKIIKLQLMLNISILTMLLGYWFNYQQNYLYLLNYTQGLFFCLCLMKMQSRKIVALLFVLVNVLFQVQSLRVVSMLLAIIVFFFQGYNSKQLYNLIYLGGCMIIFTIIRYFQTFNLEQNNNILCITISNMILAICPIMIQVISAIQMQDFKQLIISKQSANQQKGFQKLQTGDQLEENIQKK